MKSFQPLEDSLPAVDFGTPLALDRQSLGAELKCMFESLTSDPLPDHLVSLAAALDEAFSRGELFEPRGRLS